MTIAIQAQDEQARTKEASYETLTKAHNGPCVTLYTDVDSPTAYASGGLKRLNDLLQTAATSFKGTSMTVEEAEKLLESNWQPSHEFESARAGAKGIATFS